MWYKLSEDTRFVMRLVVLALIISVCFSSCNKEFDTPLSQRETSYNKSFEKYIGIPSKEQTWGDWSLNYEASTRSLVTDTTIWEEYSPVVFPSISSIDSVIIEFTKQYTGINSINVPEGNYWIVPVYKNENSFYCDIDYNIPLFMAHEKMSDICMYNGNGYESILTDTLSLIEDLLEYDGVMPQFAYYNELYSEKHFEYRVIESNNVYYVGFDFFAEGFVKETYINGRIYEIKRLFDRDCKYDDYIIMLIPADHSKKDKVLTEKRVICEDLSSSPDFDFNDLVYDVAIVNNRGTLRTRITVQAVGTTTGINIAGQEAHSLFGLSVGSCINTKGKEGSITKEPVSFYVDEIFNNIEDITVSVFYENKLYFIDSEKGEIPRRICVNKDFKWNYGEIGIWLSYPKFKDWVSNPSINWEKEYKSELVFK
jgi:hypothetical protein